MNTSIGVNKAAVTPNTGVQQGIRKQRKGAMERAELERVTRKGEQGRAGRVEKRKRIGVFQEEQRTLLEDTHNRAEGAELPVGDHLMHRKDGERR